MDYGGMTVNERLFHSGQLEEFDKAISNKEKEKVVKILRDIQLGEENVVAILKHCGLE